MKLIKLERPNCRGCGELTNFLNNRGVQYESINIMEKPEVALQYGVMGVPVLILADDSGNAIDMAIGFNQPAVEKLLEKMK